MQTILRKYMLYKSKAEGTDYAMNHVLGCSHGCQYPCVAFEQKKRFGKIQNYEQWTTPLLVANTLDLLDEEIPHLKKKISTVHLCESTDPFMYGYPIIEKYSLAAIEKLNQNMIRCTVVTKGILPQVLIDLRFNPLNEYGISLVSLSEEYRQKIEPRAAPIKERLQALKYLHENGRKTFVAIEPYPTPNIIEQSLQELLQAVSFVDKIIFGRTNYSKKATAFKHNRNFYNFCTKQVLKFCIDNCIDCQIKSRTTYRQEKKDGFCISTT